MNNYNKKSTVYVLSDRRLIQKLRNKILEKHTYLKDFALMNSIKKKTLYSWFEEGSRIPLPVVVGLLGDDYYNYLNGYFFVSGTSKYKLKIHKNLGIAESILLGWVLSEGHLGKDKCTISQYNKTVLLKLKRLCEKYYGRCGAQVYPDKKGFKLVLPTIFVYYFNNRFSIPKGKKSYIIGIPEQVKKSNSTIKHAFLSAYIEGDGSFSYYTTKYMRRPRISINTYSQRFAFDCKALFFSLEYKPKIYHHKKEYKIELFKSNDISKFYYYSFDYLIDSDKKKKFESYLSQPYILKTVFIDGRKITDNFRDQIGSWKEVALALYSLGHKTSYLTIQNWYLGYFKPSLKVILLMCDYLKEDYFKYIPIHYAGLLYLHDKISYGKLLSLKKVN